MSTADVDAVMQEVLTFPVELQHVIGSYAPVLGDALLLSGIDTPYRLIRRSSLEDKKKKFCDLYKAQRAALTDADNITNSGIRVTCIQTNQSVVLLEIGCLTCMDRFGEASNAFQALEDHIQKVYDILLTKPVVQGDGSHLIHIRWGEAFELRCFLEKVMRRVRRIPSLAKWTIGAHNKLTSISKEIRFQGTIWGDDTGSMRSVQAMIRDGFEELLRREHIIAHGRTVVEGLKAAILEVRAAIEQGGVNVREYKKLQKRVAEAANFPCPNLWGHVCDITEMYVHPPGAESFKIIQFEDEAPVEILTTLVASLLIWELHADLLLMDVWSQQEAEDRAGVVARSLRGMEDVVQSNTINHPFPPNRWEEIKKTWVDWVLVPFRIHTLL